MWEGEKGKTPADAEKKMTAVWSWIPGRGRAVADVHLSGRLSSLSENTSYALSSLGTSMFLLDMILFMWLARRLFRQSGGKKRLLWFAGCEKNNQMIIFTLGWDWGWEDGITDCTCIMCSAAIKSSTRRGKVVTMETSFVWKAHAMRRVCPWCAPIQQSQKAWRMERRHGWKWETIAVSALLRGVMTELAPRW